MHDDERDHEEHGHFVALNLGDMREMQQRQEMANHAAIHGVMDFIHALDESQLEALQMLMHSLADPRQTNVLAAHFEGIIKQVLHFKHGWCSCGERHSVAEDLLPMDQAAFEAAMSDDEILKAAEDKRNALMDQYNLIIGLSGKLTCKLCGTEYQSLRDRMLRSPDDCPHCNIKNSQG